MRDREGDPQKDREAADVRAKAADVLADIGALAQVPALAREAVGKDALLAAAARSAVYRLAKVVPPDAEETPEAQAAAFRAWWASPDRADLKVAIVREALASADTMPEDSLWPLALDEPDVRVWGEAVRALRVVAKDTAKALEKSASPAGRARGDWMRRFPPLSDADLVAAGREDARKAVVAWLEGRP